MRAELATLTGRGESQAGPSVLASSASIHSTTGAGRSISAPDTSDPQGDDPLDPVGISGSNSSRSLANVSEGQPRVVVPSITIKAEHSSITRSSKKGTQSMMAMVTVEVPPSVDRGKYPARTRPIMPSRSLTGESSPPLPPSPVSTRSAPHDPLFSPASTRSVTSPMPFSHGDTGGPFSHILADLRKRMVDYPNSGLEQAGTLRLFDLLCVRKASMVREFHVYLFQEALICVSEEKKSGFSKIFSSGSSSRSFDSRSTGGGGNKAALKLKGRIYVRHVKKILDSSVPGELSLTIIMDDEAMEPFILTFKDRSSHEMWRNNLQRILDESRQASAATPSSAIGPTQSAMKIAKLMGSGAPMPPPSAPFSRPPPFSPSTIGSANMHTSSAHEALSPTLTTSSSFLAASPMPQHNGDGGAGELAYVAPLAPVHTPLDLVVVLSLPAPSSGTSLPLKMKIVRQSLGFVLACMGPKDRISLVACEMGPRGCARRTPFLNTTRADSRRHLEAFVETLGNGPSSNISDEFVVQSGSDERFDVVTAVNAALDNVLQRQAKNPLTGMILLSDTAEVVKRAQMDLVTARLDAANVPVHTIGYGKTHDPSPLWMISNHTHGTYTFVKEWYHLRDAMAGVLGGLMSVAVTRTKLHLNCQEHAFRIVKVSGTSQAVVSSLGKDVDIELRELRHGEVREILVELEMEFPGGGMEGAVVHDDGSDRSSPTGSHLVKSPSIQSRGARSGKAPSYSTEQSVGALGIDRLSMGDTALYEDSLVDEMPVVEVDCSYHDPHAARSVARLAHPVLLTTTVLPSTSPTPSSPSDPSITRRRMELLASDMITRALLIASRKNFAHAARVMKETKRIIETIADSVASRRLPQMAVQGRSVRCKLAWRFTACRLPLGTWTASWRGWKNIPNHSRRITGNYAAQQVR